HPDDAEERSREAVPEAFRIRWHPARVRGGRGSRDRERGDQAPDRRAWTSRDHGAGDARGDVRAARFDGREEVHRHEKRDLEERAPRAAARGRDGKEDRVEEGGVRLALAE